MNPKRMIFAALTTALLVAPAAWADVAGGDHARLSSQYADWAGSRSNADALVAGLRDGASITLVTTGGAGRSPVIAGFTAPSRMTYGEIRGALNAARQNLSRMGITRPTAEELQTALIGGEIGTRQVAGVIGARRSVPPVAAVR